MHVRSAMSALFSTSMILLVLMASLPQVVCCCNVSWGPIGIFGGESLCKASGTAQCCCCQHESPARSEKCSRTTQWTAEKCDCTFHLASPNPITVDQPVSVCMTVPAAQPTLLVADTMQSSQYTLDTRSAEAGRQFLTAVSRCAFMQSWSI